MADEKRDKGEQQQGRRLEGFRSEGLRSPKDQRRGAAEQKQGPASESANPEGRSGKHYNRHRGSRGRSGQDFARVGRGAERGQTQDHQREARPEEAEEPRVKREALPCALCSKPIFDLSTALTADQESGAPAHFDCVLEKVAGTERLSGGEKIVYLGSGAFGVVEFKDRSETAFIVKRRIQWEKEGEKKDWRKLLSSRISSM